MRMRSTSRTRELRSSSATLLCSLLLTVPAFVRAQSALQPQPHSDTQSGPTAQSAAPDNSQRTAQPGPDQGNQLHTASRIELDVVKVLVAQEHAWNAGDIEDFVKSFKDSPDTIFIGKQVSKGFQQILDDYRHNFTTRSSMGNLVYSELEVTALSDSFAVCTGRYHLDRGRKDGGPADGLFSLVLEKTDQGWKIVLDHTT